MASFLFRSKLAIFGNKLKVSMYSSVNLMYVCDRKLMWLDLNSSLLLIVLFPFPFYSSSLHMFSRWYWIAITHHYLLSKVPICPSHFSIYFLLKTPHKSSLNIFFLVNVLILWWNFQLLFLARFILSILEIDNSYIPFNSNKKMESKFFCDYLSQTIFRFKVNL